MIKTISIAALALGSAVAAHAALNTSVYLPEQQMAQQEEARIIKRPIAGIENKFWFNYRVNVVETQKELRSDLNDASDAEDLRDAWDEYRQELSDNRYHYVKVMAKRGYREPSVTIVD